MAVENHQLRYRPLCPGVMIYNPRVGRRGTLGLFATSNGADRWLISANHVLQPDTNPQALDPVYQPFNGASQDVVARTSITLSNTNLDFGAAEIEPGIAVNNFLLGVGVLGPPRSPRVGLHVMKAGSATGITEGVIEHVDSDKIRIVVPSAYPAGYILSSVGDSGAVWVARSSRRPVALHVGGNVTGPETATAIAISRVFADFGLSLLA